MPFELPLEPLSDGRLWVDILGLMDDGGVTEELYDAESVVEEDFPEITSPLDWVPLDVPLDFSVDRDVLRKLERERLRRFLKRGMMREQWKRPEESRRKGRLRGGVGRCAVAGVP